MIKNVSASEPLAYPSLCAYLGLIPTISVEPCVRQRSRRPSQPPPRPAMQFCCWQKPRDFRVSSCVPRNLSQDLWEKYLKVQSSVAFGSELRFGFVFFTVFTKACQPRSEPRILVRKMHLKLRWPTRSPTDHENTAFCRRTRRLEDTGATKETPPTSAAVPGSKL